MNDQQDEGRIDPQEEAYSRGISEFARLEEERQDLIAQGVPEDELETPMDPSALTGDERALVLMDDGDDLDCSTPPPMDEMDEPSEVVQPEGTTAEEISAAAQELYDESEARSVQAHGGALVPYQDEAPGGSIGLAPTTKDTNPKDGVGSLKPSYSTVPVPVLYELGAAITEGARKYGAYNWRVAGVRTSVYIDAARRHLDSFWEGENIDPDSGLSHITKAIASLTVLRDAQIQGMVQNDDRPPMTMAPYMDAMTQQMAELRERYPVPKHPFTQAELAHVRNEVVNTQRGQVRGFDIEVMLPGPDEHPEGFVWAQQGSTRTDLDLALSVAQALREDGYEQRVVRVTGIFDRVEEMRDGQILVNTAEPIREQVVTVFPGDPSLTEEGQ